MKFIENGSVTSVPGFEASGITAGLKKSGNPDMAAVFSANPCVAAGAFTQNLFAAAPVNFCRKVLDNSVHHGVIVNSGIANASTGEQGEKDALEMANIFAKKLSQKYKDLIITGDNVFVSSTGRIGPFLPMPIVENGIDSAVNALESTGGISAAKAIMTTDTVPKYLAVEFEIDGNKICIGGMTKGAGMINPQMKGKYATMLAYLTTDANVEKDFLQWCLDMTLDESFNRISIDGDTSTNDTYLIFSNCLAKNSLLTFENRESENAQIFLNAMKKLSAELARRMVLDGEGATKFVEIVVKNAATKSDAKICAEYIANSLLCKTAWFGGDPNWGRIIMAAGNSGAKINTAKTELFYNGLKIFTNGLDAGVSAEKQAAEIAKKEFQILLDIGVGSEIYTVWTCDVSYEYVKINADYHT